MNPTEWNTIQKIRQLLAAPTVDPSQRAARIRAVERDIIMPIKGLFVVIVAHYLFFSGWFDVQGSGREQALGLLRRAFYIYLTINVITASIFIWGRQISLKQLEWLVFFVGLVDGLLVAALTGVTEGSDSMLYWVFLGLILHNALAIPVAIPQLVLNILVSFCYLVGAYTDRWLQAGNGEEFRYNSPRDRVIELVLWAVCCYGIQMLFEKQKRAESEATEFAVRQERLHTAGRLAAEIAHQIKNPLGIITNAAFCLQHAPKNDPGAIEEQVEIIREEVEKADRIITELMGYAQLAEGRVEPLNVPEEIDQAVAEVFPPAAKYSISFRKHYASNLPSLLMQRRHLLGAMVNILQNAREAMNGCGEIDLTARFGANDSIVIIIADNGPGIPTDKIGRIFDAYFTTRHKGTGLGLAIVKHNTEMYGGTVHVQSELGKGTRFILEFPPRILIRLNK